MGMKNKGRHFTVMIIPHTEEAVWSLRVPLFLLQIAGVLVVFALLAVFVVFQSYQRLQQESLSAEHLSKENRFLNEQVDVLAGTTEELRLRLEAVEQMGDSLRRLVDMPAAGGKGKGANPEQSPPLNAADISRILPDRGTNPVLARAEVNITALQQMLPQRMEEATRIKEEILERQQRSAATPSIWPVHGMVSSEFGRRRSPFTGRREFHDGIDIVAPPGTPVHGGAGGRVILVTYQRGLGNVIIVEHGYGYRTLYGHLSGFSVSTGDEIEKGQPIGYVGNTGMSTGPHLHYTVFVRGVAVNPREFMP
ncbi:MAG TPA: hypothetical protein DCQ14_07305 [Firmicutes bacterium]|nr:hypothetical protein [Bacillota bacterium]